MAVAGDYGCDVVGFVWGDGTVLTEVELVKFSICYFFGECQDGYETGHHVKAWCETTSHVEVERWSGWSMRATGPHVVRRATELWRLIGET